MQTLLVSLIPPLNLSLVLLAGALLAGCLRWWRSVCGLVVIGLFWSLAWSLPVTSLWLGGALEAHHPYQEADDLPQADAIVVLGGHTALHRANWFLPLASTATRSRIARAAELYHAKRAPRLLLSGGAREGNVSEARSMAAFARQRGVPAGALLLEHASRSTFENARLSAQLLAAAPEALRAASLAPAQAGPQAEPAIERILLVTSALHMPRARATFAKQTGLTVIAAPVAPQIRLPDEGGVPPWRPNWAVLAASRTIVKEYAAWWLYRLRAWL